MYKNIEDQRANNRAYYHLHKDQWRTPEGKWKKKAYTVEERRALVSKSYWKHREKRLLWHKQQNALKKRFGICPICQKDKQVVYDHDHKTGLFRNWICSNCNLMLGHSFDNTETLERAVNYLVSKGQIV